MFLSNYQAIATKNKNIINKINNNNNNKENIENLEQRIKEIQKKYKLVCRQLKRKTSYVHRLKKEKKRLISKLIEAKEKEKTREKRELS